jgi:hypothetical protein
VAAAAGLAVGAYGAYAGATWLRYGHPTRASQGDEDPGLDHFMPTYDVVERHQIRVNAPAAATLEAARHLDLLQVPVARLIFRSRELILGATPEVRVRPRGLLEELQSLGWVVLAESPGREIVVGAVTRPWEANVTFRSVAPGEFRQFAEADYVKIVWTLRADPISSSVSMFRTETRAIATDSAARAKFRRYWAFLSPGIFLIRRMSLVPIKSKAEARIQ